jgi:hypothetical protein
MGGEPSLMGALLILGHRQPLKQTAPPIAPVARAAHEQGAILDWEKHTWPWSTMLVPVAGVDTIELSNNSMWRQRTISKYLWGRRPMAWVGEPPLDSTAFVHYGFESYYAMLNGGFSMRPSAGSANGVHPVPLGTSRVYVRTDGRFSYETWLEAYRRGRSFATNGPMLLLRVDGMEPGERRTLSGHGRRRATIEAEVLSVGELDRTEIVLNGRVALTVPAADMLHIAPHTWRYRGEVELNGSSWVAARCWEKTNLDNPRFAHTGAAYFDDARRPLRPEPRQIAYLIESVAEQIARGQGKLPEPVLDEFRTALRFYEQLSPAPGHTSPR